MSIEQIAQQFMQSPHGAGAWQALQQQGFSPSVAQQILGHSAYAGAAHLEQHHNDRGGLLGEHAGLGFFAAFASGVLRGDGFVGALEDGAAGVVLARITEALTARMGLDSRAADAAAAATAPYVVAFLKQRLGV